MPEVYLDEKMNAPPPALRLGSQGSLFDLISNIIMLLAMVCVLCYVFFFLV